jgi:hypothetical protein
VRAIDRRRQEQQRLTHAALGLSPQARVFTGQVQAADMLANLLRQPHDGTAYADGISGDGVTPYFMVDYDSVDGDNPIQ